MIEIFIQKEHIDRNEILDEIEGCWLVIFAIEGRRFDSEVCWFAIEGRRFAIILSMRLAIELMVSLMVSVQPASTCPSSANLLLNSL